MRMTKRERETEREREKEREREARSAVTESDEDSDRCTRVIRLILRDRRSVVSPKEIHARMECREQIKFRRRSPSRVTMRSRGVRCRPMIAYPGSDSSPPINGHRADRRRHKKTNDLIAARRSERASVRAPRASGYITRRYAANYRLEFESDPRVFAARIANRIIAVLA